MRSFLLLGLFAGLAAAAPTEVENTLQARQKIPPSNPPVQGPVQFIDCNKNTTFCPKNGPSGKLLSPNGGDNIPTSYLNDGFLDLKYTTVNKETEDYTIYTTAIKVALESNPTNNPDIEPQQFPLALLSPPHKGANINAQVTIPSQYYDNTTFGGFWVVAIEEYQAYKPKNKPLLNGAYAYPIKFRAAAPTIFISNTIVP